PNETAELKIDNQVMKTVGKAREFDVVGLDPKKEYEYELIVKFEPNNYTTITRKKTVVFKGSQAEIVADLSKDQPDDKAVIRFVPTPDDIVKKMLELGKVGKDDVVYDLGCGDGRIVIAAVRDGKALAGIGVDLDPERVKESRENVKKANLEGKVEIRQGDVLEIKDLADASVVMLYMSDELGKLLEPRLKKLLQPGARVVSHRFTLGDWKPDQTVNVMGDDGDEYTLHVWTVPKK
ncbi:MAG: class I SAM-dependent methyltransferase, partial [Planctomycetia bacterium]|nr:class I SAM-dependent methyltransferase [Planctomycetia bacterium]